MTVCILQDRQQKTAASCDLLVI